MENRSREKRIRGKGERGKEGREAKQGKNKGKEV